MVAGGRKTTGGLVAPAPVAAVRQTWIIYSTDYRLDPAWIAGTEKRNPIRLGHIRWRALGACAVKG
jgi:hypothetical protein